ncbi:uncharacterized sulfatase [Dysgonomonas macrotermitis]|uniref:Uncharacterized sulfatase n=2 Tax=Dysgonomonas macrotermitis TaxID=1346286 RepID=A0A1M4WHK5_9BACT|nr:uncharacterized sulfatase [Dysgonomonas macrotermitis]
MIKHTVLLLPLVAVSSFAKQEQRRPNILFVIADDQSYPDASIYGSSMVRTPGFDLVASQGALFNNAYVTSPGSSPSRASMLTGMYPWQIEEAGTHASSFPAKYICYPDILAKSGYHIGFTGKGWGPGDWAVSGRLHNPAGPEYNTHKLDPPYSGISKVDYTANFKQFLSERDKDQPFCFWLGTHEPHRPYENMSWLKEGNNLSMAAVPGFLPPSDDVKGDLLDYAVEIEWFDKHLMNCIEELKRIGELDNTIIIVTADNGMSFPHAKANCYDAGLHVPLAICWGDKVKPSQVVNNLVSLVDLAPTILQIAGLEPHTMHVGESLLPLITGNGQTYSRKTVFAGRERHSYSRFDNWGYPMRSVRWKNYLLVHNFHPERWPAGDPQELGKNDEPKEIHKGYFDIDAAPSKDYLVSHRNDPSVTPFFNASVAKRPEYELYNLKNDPACMKNIASDTKFNNIISEMKQMLQTKLEETNDSRIGSNPEIWESYPRTEGKMRKFPDKN